MNSLEIILIGIGLSMDAVGVCLSNSMVFKNLTLKKRLAMPLFFGFFQGLMPLIGYFTGEFFAQYITRYSRFIVFLILGAIGIKMLKDAFCTEEKCKENNTPLTYQLLFTQAIATSIDALAVGVGFSTLSVNIFAAITLISLTTFVCSYLAVYIGKKFGSLLENKAQLLGGCILVLIAIKALF
ncbi:hypothetical protein CS063_00265 [Sporanaerobium hydrogeniformans]|uniref:Uncharacterized protein n=1 Tax=Sporanaerobium hydrogeniformans TaxID=3072179 RepID=A0AC61DGE6_9FIRM|nr:manganese efflux pump MntP family protein [Sporanaerobium hydrogeniformans]PHV71945.1 hypothetical protein CS063_00265 [Sporanaerobium hydrogeniformans]